MGAKLQLAGTEEGMAWWFPGEALPRATSEVWLTVFPEYQDIPG